MPLAYKNELKLKLDSMEKDGIISKVTEPTDWVSSMVVVKKPNGKLRICLDPTDLNKAIKRPHFPLPTLDEVLPHLKKGKFFSMMDASNGYWQV